MVSGLRGVLGKLLEPVAKHVMTANRLGRESEPVLNQNMVEPIAQDKKHKIRNANVKSSIVQVSMFLSIRYIEQPWR